MGTTAGSGRTADQCTEGFAVRFSEQLFIVEYFGAVLGMLLTFLVLPRAHIAGKLVFFHEFHEFDIVTDTGILVAVSGDLKDGPAQGKPVLLGLGIRTMELLLLTGFYNK